MTTRVSPLRLYVLAVASLTVTGCPRQEPQSGEFGDTSQSWRKADTTLLADAANADTTPSADTAADTDTNTAPDTNTDTDTAPDTSTNTDTAPDIATDTETGCQTATHCDDNNTCTVDKCSAGACEHLPVSGSCVASGCTLGDTCGAGVCQAGKPRYFVSSYAEFGHVDSVAPVIPTLDGGMISAFSTFDKSTGARWGWYVRANEAGEIVKKMALSTGYNSVYDLLPLSTGGLVVAGTAYSFNGVYNGWMVRLDAAEKAQWQQVYGDKSAGAIADVTLTDGGSQLAFAGHIQWQGNHNGWLGKVQASNGSVKWAIGYGTAPNELLTAVSEVANGGLVAAGVAGGGTLGGNDIWVLKVDSAGKSVWSKHFGGAKDDEGRWVAALTDGTMLVGGNTSSLGAGAVDMWMAQLDASGKLMWQRTFGGAGNDWFSTAYVNGSGGWLFGSTASKGKGLASLWLLRVGTDLSTIWDAVLGGGETAFGSAMWVESSGRISLSMWQTDAAGTNTATLGRADAWGHTSCAAAGACLGKTEASCNDGDPCTMDSCGDKGCAHKTAANGVWCGAPNKQCAAGKCG